MLGQNVLASMLLTMGISLALAVVAKAVAVGLGLTGSIDLLALATVSIVGRPARARSSCWPRRWG